MNKFKFGNALLLAIILIGFVNIGQTCEINNLRNRIEVLELEAK